LSDGGRRLRGLSGEEVVRAFERAGYAVSRVRGSHYVLTHPQRTVIAIPRHRELKVGLLISKIKAAGLTVQEFERLL
jgi:predicted RNA binding protein YcfA (HicA-like mRNA interferase family)